MSKLTPLMKQFWDVKSVHPDKIVLFRMGDFFEMFHDDAVIAAPILNITLTQRNKKSEDSTPMCGVPQHSVAGPINKLLSAGYKVAICDQIEDPKQAKGLVKRAVTRILTPGMVYDPDQLEADESNFLCSFDESGAAFVDSTTHEAFFYTSTDMRQCEQLLRVIAPVEVVLEEGQSAPNGCSAHLSHFRAKKDRHAVSCVSRLIEYMESLLSSKTQLGGPTFEFEERQLIEVMPLNESTLRHLEAFRTYQGEKKPTLFSVLNQTKTAPGARCLKRWLAFPLCSKSAVEGRHQRVEEFKRDVLRLRTIRENLSGIGDIERRLTKSLLASGHPRELQGLQQNIYSGLQVSAQMPEEAWNEDHLQKAMAVFEKIQGTLREELPTQLKDGGFIKVGVNQTLDNYFDLTENAQKKLRELEEKEREKTSIPSLKIRYNNVFGYYIEVTNAHKGKVPKEYLRKQTLTNAERYSTEELQELERQILAAQSKKLNLEHEILAGLRQEIAEIRPELVCLAQKWAEIDVLCCFAHLALEKNYVRPKFCEHLRLVDSRHPVVEQSTDFVPNTIDLKKSDCLLLTGPNMAGKSTIMRQVAIAALMAQIGCPVPASVAEMPVFDCIFTRIGASDHLTEGLSTFMVEMVESAEILSNATERSLVILDEVGRGTSTYDGMSLAQSLLEFLVSQKRSMTFFATHYFEMTALEEQIPAIKNAHMSIRDDGGRFEFLHTLVSGPASRSYGIHVAELAGLPQEVTERAKQLLAGHEAEKGKVDSQMSFLSQLDVSEGVPKLDHPAKVEFVQDPLIGKIKEFPIAETTPLQALNQIAVWKEEVTRGGTQEASP